MSKNKYSFNVLFLVILLSLNILPKCLGVISKSSYLFLLV